MNQPDNKLSLKALSDQFEAEEEKLREGGGQEGRERQARLGRMVVRDRVAKLIDKKEFFFEIGLWAGYQMYSSWGALPAAGVVTGIGRILGRHCLVIANDATVKAGAFFPQTVKKVLRAQRIAYNCSLPIVYLVDSSGVFLPLQDEIFPDEDDFGRIFRNNAVLSSIGIPQYAAIMGNCIAGGGYLPVLCDKLLMTEGSGLYLAGPALVKAAIGQVVDTEELGGVKMHSEISGTVDFREPDDLSCLNRLRALIDLLPHETDFLNAELSPEKPVREVYQIVDGSKEYDIRDLLACFVDEGSFLEFKADYGKTLVTAYAKIGGFPVAIVANQRKQVRTAQGKVEIGGVIYSDSADKAARFIMDSNQTKVPLIFFQDVVGFMVGKEAEQSGIIRSGAKLVNVISNSIVPKITVIIGSSFGAGNYALCGKAYDPDFIVAWPNARYAVMGADQAAETLLSIQQKAVERQEKKLAEEEMNQMREKIRKDFSGQMDIRYGAARGWIDAIIAPHKTRELLLYLLPLVHRRKISTVGFHTGVLQV